MKTRRLQYLPRLAFVVAVSALVSAAACGRGPSLPGQYAVLGGGAVRQAVGALKGEVVVLNFWATWCQPCREEFPSLVKLDEKYRARGLRVVGISVDEVEDIDGKVRPFVEQVGARFPIWVKGPGDPMDFMDSIDRRLSGAIPETLIFNREGEVVQVLEGEQTLEQFEAAVASRL